MVRVVGPVSCMFDGVHVAFTSEGSVAHSFKFLMCLSIRVHTLLWRHTAARCWSGSFTCAPCLVSFIVCIVEVNILHD